jgi:hypothetical protein
MATSAQEFSLELVKEKEYKDENCIDLKLIV